MQTTNRWQVGNATVTRVIESEAGAFPPGFMFTGLTEERVRSIKWLHPHYATEDGNIRFSLHTYVIESDGKTIIVDTCMGNDKDRAFEGWNRQSLPFLEWLADAGFPADSIDIVLCTHLHTDHVGWNTRWDGPIGSRPSQTPAICLAVRNGSTGVRSPPSWATCRQRSRRPRA